MGWFVSDCYSDQHYQSLCVEDALNAAQAARLFAAGTLKIEAQSYQNIINLASHRCWRRSSEVAGFGGIKILNSVTSAYAGKYAKINQSGTGSDNQDVVINAINQVVSVGMAGTGAGGGAAGVGAAGCNRYS